TVEVTTSSQSQTNPAIAFSDVSEGRTLTGNSMTGFQAAHTVGDSEYEPLQQYVEYGYERWL
ncbi:MAG: hypothetical protein V5A49_11535, partial [Haloarcula sp.]